MCYEWWTTEGESAKFPRLFHQTATIVLQLRDQTELSDASSDVSWPPINALPHELFAHILYRCCEATSPGQDLYDLLLSITAVCRHWRDVAIASSELWTKIAVGKASYIHHANRFLERSASRLIDVHVKITSLFSRDHSQIFVDTIKPHLVRLRSLQVTIHSAEEFRRPTDSENYALIQEVLSSIHLPHLTHLLVHSQTLIPSNSAHATIHAPNLRWSNVHHLPISSITALPHLTTLIIHEFRPTWREFRDVVLTCSSLKTLIIPSFTQNWRPFSPDRDANDAVSRISAPSLRSLAISISQQDKCLFVLEMPNLEYLEKSGNGSISKYFTSLPKLTTLRLINTRVADEESIVRSLSQLRRLELIDAYSDAQVATSYPQGTNCPFPRLSSLAYVSEEKATLGTRDWLLGVARLGASPFTIELGGDAVNILDFTEEYEVDALGKRGVSIINAGIPAGLVEEKDWPDYEDYSDNTSQLGHFEDDDFWEEEDVWEEDEEFWYDSD